MARALDVAVKLGVFETLNDSAMTSEEVAGRVGTYPYPTGKLLNALTVWATSAWKARRYSLTTDARKWLVGRSSTSLRDWILEQEFIEWPALDRLEAFLRTGGTQDFHADLGEEDWALYQRGDAKHRKPFRCRAGPAGAGSASRPGHARRRRFPWLPLGRALSSPPESPLNGFGPSGGGEERRPFAGSGRDGQQGRPPRGGDASTDDLGVETFDLVYTANLVHHLEDGENRDLARRVARALRRGGHYVIVDSVRPRSAKLARLGRSEICTSR